MMISRGSPVVITVDYRQVGLGGGCCSNHTLRVDILYAVVTAVRYSVS